MAKIAVIGYGTIGRHVVERAPYYGHEVETIVRQRGICNVSEKKVVLPFGYGDDPVTRAQFVANDCLSRGVSCVMLAIPSGGEGLDEAWYITELCKAKIKVVTAGKSALANQFKMVEPHLESVGFDATVGGGTMIPTFLREHLYANKEHPFVLTAVINGTLNYAQTRVLDGASPEQICDEALRLGFAEPPMWQRKLTPHTMYVGEFADISRKIAIICNTRLLSLTGRIVSQKDFIPEEFHRDTLQQVMGINANYRYLVRIGTKSSDLDFLDAVPTGGRINSKVGDIHVGAGFVRLAGALCKWMPDHVGNAVHLQQNGDSDIRIGQGAGPVPTVGAMFCNLRRFIEAN